MAVAIRLRREGTRNAPYYKVVVADKRSPRDGKFIEIVGNYDPKKTGTNYTVKLARIDHWVKNGAQMSDTVRSIVKKARGAEAKAFLTRYEARLAEARSKLAQHQGEQMSIVRWNPKGPSFMYQGTFASSVVESMGLVRPSKQQGTGAPHSPALSLESLNLLDADWLVVGTLSASGDAVDAMRQAEQTPAFQQLPVIKAKRFGAVDGSLWTSSGGPQAALKVIEDVEQLLATRS